MNGSHESTTRVASFLNLLAGIWFFISPWVYSADHQGNAWNSWIVGAVIVILAASRMSNPGTQTWMSGVNALLGIWAFISPWVYSYSGDTARLINNLCVGVVVFVLAIISASSTPHTHTTTPPLPTHTQ